MPFDAALTDEDSLSDDAYLLLEMRRRAYKVFARQLADAAPKPMPDWVAAIVALWSLEALQ